MSEQTVPVNARPSDAEATETAWRIHGAVGEWTARVDAKASFALTLEAAALAGILTMSQAAHSFATSRSDVVGVLLWSGIVCLLSSALCALLVVFPRLRPARDLRAEARQGLVYFGHLRFWDPADLAAELTRTDMLRVLSDQLVLMSDIAWRKHRLVQCSFGLAATGGTLVALAVAAAP